MRRVASLADGLRSPASPHRASVASPRGMLLIIVLAVAFGCSPVRTQMIGEPAAPVPAGEVKVVRESSRAIEESAIAVLALPASEAATADVALEALRARAGALGATHMVFGRPLTDVQRHLLKNNASWQSMPPRVRFAITHRLAGDWVALAARPAPLPPLPVPAPNRASNEPLPGTGIIWPPPERWSNTPGGATRPLGPLPAGAIGADTTGGVAPLGNGADTGRPRSAKPPAIPGVSDLPPLGPAPQEDSATTPRH